MLRNRGGCRRRIGQRGLSLGLLRPLGAVGLASLGAAARRGGEDVHDGDGVLEKPRRDGVLPV